MNDIFEVEVSDDDGSTWTDLETVGPAGQEVDGGWYHKEFLVSNFVDNTDEFMIRFTASDRNDGSVVEAGVDGVQIKVTSCGDPCVGDLDGSGEVDFNDLLQLLSAWGPCSFEDPCDEDLDENDEVDFNDVLLLLANWGPCDDG